MFAFARKHTNTETGFFVPSSRGYTRYKLQTAAIERDEELRAKFREVMDSGAFCSSQLVAVDETLKKGHEVPT